MNGVPDCSENFVLPPAPPTEVGAVKVWSEPVSIPTYEPFPPDPNPAFLENRVYQGSSGRVYPLPFIDRIATDAHDRLWQAIHIENEFLRIVVLPEIGGRIHVGLDKTNNYDFIYRQNVIKPALVGLAGPWISGGIEFNWPQHHRPATFMPVETHIERHSDGSATIWLSDHDPMHRMKGMHGVCLHPGKALLELKVRLYNRTPFVQTFLWWANMAVRVHEQYQSVFPPDVQYVADHAKRATSRFPLCSGKYYGIDYNARACFGVPAAELPPQFVPPGTYPPNDLSWYANIPVPTSYMALGSKEDFFGGYDHERNAGFVHIANHHISPGKKQWTWGNHNFGYAWDRNLTDDDGPYVELMAGVYTDNQPDFSFLAPGETKTFSQFWMPVQKIGPASRANTQAAVHLSVQDGQARLGVCVSEQIEDATVTVQQDGDEIYTWRGSLIPGSPLVHRVDVSNHQLHLSLRDSSGKEILSYPPAESEPQNEPQPASAPAPPGEIESVEELYLTGLHLDQYRHATRSPEDYWLEGLRRDPHDSRCNNALGLRRLRRGQFREAEQHFRRAIERLTVRNPNPFDGEPFYNLGLTLRFQNHESAAYDAFYKAAWNYPWRAPSYQALAEIDVGRRDWSTAHTHLLEALRTNAGNLQARNLLTITLRALGSTGEADAILQQTLALDPLDVWARYLESGSLPLNNQLILDLAFDFARGRLYADAVAVLERANFASTDGSVPIIYYALGHFYTQLNHYAAASAAYSRAKTANPIYCFPSRLEEMLMLEAAINRDPSDPRAPYYLGNLYYDRLRHYDAIRVWEASARLDPSFPTVWRNLGIAYFNVHHDAVKAQDAYQHAWNRNPADARVFYERDQLRKRLGVPPAARLAELEMHPDLVALRDDLSVELATLYNQTRRPAHALEILLSRRFQPWEGGEGLVLAQYVNAHLALGRAALLDGRLSEGRRHFEEALAPPESLGEAPHLLANQSNIYFWLGAAHQMLDDESSATRAFQHAAATSGDFQQMSVQPFSEMSYYAARALQRLGRHAEAGDLLTQICNYGCQLERQKGEADFFATSLPSLLLFHDDLDRRNVIAGKFLQVQALSALGSFVRMQILLAELLALDPNHPLAATWDDEMETERQLTRSVAFEG